MVELDNSMQATLAAALAYREAGLSLIPVAIDGTKSPFFRAWKEFQSRLPWPSEVFTWFSYHQLGIGIVAGAVSGGLEVIDCDDESISEAWMGEVDRRIPTLHLRVPRVRTPRPGLHAYFRRPTAQPSRPLARRADPKTGRPKTLIETRGEGSYVIAPGSHPLCHSSGRTYTLLDGPSLAEIPMVSDEEYEVLIGAAQALNQFEIRPNSPPPPRRVARHRGNRPGDLFESQTDWADVLIPFGWTWVGEAGDGTGYWRRPGKQQGISATTNHKESDRLYVFSSNASPLESDRSYSRFEAYAVLAFGGDLHAAARFIARSWISSPQ